LREDGSAEASRVIRPRQQMRSRRWSTLRRNALDKRSVARSSRIPPQKAVLGFSWSRIRLHAELDARRGVRVEEKRCPVLHRRHWGARHLSGFTTGLVSFLRCPTRAPRKDLRPRNSAPPDQKTRRPKEPQRVLGFHSKATEISLLVEIDSRDASSSVGGSGRGGHTRGLEVEKLSFRAKET
jgi:hypothetical protein